VKEQPTRQGRNPRTGARIVVPSKTALAFKAGKEMRDRLNPNS
jgi:integration host factor subunit beta